MHIYYENGSWHGGSASADTFKELLHKLQLGPAQEESKPKPVRRRGRAPSAAVDGPPRHLDNSPYTRGRWSQEYDAADDNLAYLGVGKTRTFRNPFKSARQAYEYQSNRRRRYNRVFSLRHVGDDLEVKRIA